MEERTEMKAAQYLTFVLGEETFALDIAKVREVLDYPAITRVPQTPVFVRGVTNLRGGVVPVVDLRLKFGMGATERTINTCVIIVEVDIGGGFIVLGALADSVKEVMDLAEGQIEPAPALGAHLDTRFLKGVGKKGDGFILMLDIDRVFSEAEMGEVVSAEGRSVKAGR